MTSNQEPSLAHVQRGVVRRPRRYVLHGPPMAGKTTFAACFPAPLFIDTEDGSSELDVARWPFEVAADGTVLRTRPRSFGEVMHALHAIARQNRDGTFRTLVIDTLDALEVLLHAEVRAQQNWTATEFAEFGRGATASLNLWSDLLAAVELVWSSCQMDVVLICHSDLRTIDQPMQPAYDKWSLKLYGTAKASPSAKLIGWADIVCFAEMQAALGRTDKRTKKAKIASLDTQRRLHTVASAAYDAKNRVGLPPVLPLDYQAFASALQGAEKHDDREEVTAEILALAEQLCSPVEIEATRGWLEENPSDIQLHSFLNKLNVRRDELAREAGDE